MVNLLEFTNLTYDFLIFLMLCFIDTNSIQFKFCKKKTFEFQSNSAFSIFNIFNNFSFFNIYNFSITSIEITTSLSDAKLPILISN